MLFYIKQILSFDFELNGFSLNSEIIELIISFTDINKVVSGIHSDILKSMD